MVVCTERSIHVNAALVTCASRASRTMKDVRRLCASPPIRGGYASTSSSAEMLLPLGARGNNRSRRHLMRRLMCQATGEAQEDRRRPENVPGDVFVDHTCINCDTCRWMSPDVFAEVGGQAAVVRQPQGAEERTSALQALLACPTASIHTVESPKDIKRVQDTIPIPVCLPRGDEDEDEDVDDDVGIYHLAYHSQRSYGATPYLISLSRDCGDDSVTVNVMVDSPRWSAPLADRLEAMGGVHVIFLTHRDDVADHDRWAERFGAQRVMHALDVGAKTKDVEHKLRGSGPWALRFRETCGESGGEKYYNDGGSERRRVTVEVALTTGNKSNEVRKDEEEEEEEEEELLLIHTPGHTAGCVSLLYTQRRGERRDAGGVISSSPGAGVLFTGDHLAGRRCNKTTSTPYEKESRGGSSSSTSRLPRLTAFPNYCWDDWRRQRASVEKLLGLRFTAILPGHGRRAIFRGVDEKDAALLELLRVEP